MTKDEHPGTAVITGATSGIGAAFAENLASRGYDLLIQGRRESLLRRFADRLETTYLARVSTVIAELSDSRDLSRLISAVKATGRITLLVNNAGFGMAGAFTSNPDRNQQMFDVHVTAALLLIQAVAENMKQTGIGSIINVASVAGFFPMPQSATYSATKRFLLTFSESLYLELRPFGVNVQVLCPGMTRTDFHSRDKAGKAIENRNVLGWMSAQTVARRSLKHLHKPKAIYVPGLVNKFLVYVVSHMPRRLYYGIVSRVMP